MLRMARHVHRETGMREPLPRRRRGAQLRRQRPAAARGAVRAALDPAGGRRRRRRARRRARDPPHGARQRRGARLRRATRMHGALPRPGVRRRRRSKRSSRGSARSTSACRRDAAARARGASCWPRRRSSAGSRAAWSSARARSARRSILGDPRSPQMQSVMNLKIKFRESFRPFAPSVLREHVREWFELDVDSPVHAAGRAGARSASHGDDRRSSSGCFGIEKLNVPRSTIPGGHARRLLGAHPDRARARPTRSTTRCSSAFTRSPAARCSSTRASTCAASRSCARPRTPTAASCARRWTPGARLVRPRQERAAGARRRPGVAVGVRAWIDSGARSRLPTARRWNSRRGAPG